MSSHRFVRREERQSRAEADPAKRYWPGRAPDWYKEDGEGAEDGDVPVAESAPAAFGKLAVKDEPGAAGIAAPTIVKKADPRLERLQAAQGEAEPSGRHIAPAQVVRRRHATPSDDEEEEAQPEPDAAEDEAAAPAEPASEEDEETVAHRAALRARLRAQAAQEEEVLAEGASDLESDECSGEYETDSDEDARQLLKPTFTQKRDRETIAERERIAQEEARVAAERSKQLELRKGETKSLVIDRLRMEDAAAKAAKAGPKEIGDIDTDDEQNEEQEYELWKSREMSRIRRNKEVRERVNEAEEEREMLKNMNDEERRQWERENPKQMKDSDKKKWRFLQKYWHKGAYFQEGSDNAFVADKADEIFGRDYSAPVGEDKLDKTVLPKIMQVKNFGRRGRTKYTHLVDQDTTEFTDPMASDTALRTKRKLAGTDLLFSRPKQLKT